MPVAVKKNIKDATDAKKKAVVPLKNAKNANKPKAAGIAPNVAKKPIQAGKKTTEKTTTKPRVATITTTTKQRDNKSGKVEAVKQNGLVKSTKVAKKKDNYLQKTAAKSVKTAVTTTHKNKPKPVKKTKIHPEVQKLVKIITGTIRNLTLDEIADENSDQSENEEGSTCEPWRFDSYSDDSESSESSCCSASDCSCCTDSCDETTTDNTSSSCSDDIDECDNSSSCYNNNSNCDDSSGCDEHFIDEYTFSDEDEDYVDETCNGCNKCMPSTCSDSFTDNSESNERVYLAKLDQKPKVKTQKSLKKSKKASLKSKKTTTKAKTTKKHSPLKKTKKVQPKSIKPATRAKAKFKPAATSTQAIISPAAGSPAATSTQAIISPAASTKVANSSKVAKVAATKIAAQTSAFLKVPFNHLTTTNSSTTASTSSGCSSWASNLSSLKPSVEKIPTTQRKSLQVENTKTKAATIAVRPRRSVGINCQLPNANSTFKNNWWEKPWR